MIGLRGYASFNLGFVATIWWALPAMHFSDIRVPYEIGVFRQQGSPPPPPIQTLHGRRQQGRTHL